MRENLSRSLELRVERFRFRVSDLGFKASGVGFRVYLDWLLKVYSGQGLSPEVGPSVLGPSAECWR